MRIQAPGPVRGSASVVLSAVGAEASASNQVNQSEPVAGWSARRWTVYLIQNPRPPAGSAARR